MAAVYLRICVEATLTLKYPLSIQTFFPELLQFPLKRVGLVREQSMPYNSYILPIHSCASGLSTALVDNFGHIAFKMFDYNFIHFPLGL